MMVIMITAFNSPIITAILISVAVVEYCTGSKLVVSGVMEACIRYSAQSRSSKLQVPLTHDGDNDNSL